MWIRRQNENNHLLVDIFSDAALMQYSLIGGTNGFEICAELNNSLLTCLLERAVNNEIPAGLRPAKLLALHAARSSLWKG
jgi:hypothetical protein